ncbi:MAG: S1 RNA-binding domain-containing protein [Firmicutes bacterium]|nr:S1 RNA-binding domain-containing protein [Bacillota bacterium]
MTKYKQGDIVKGTITGIESYGAFVSLEEYYTGLIHISELSYGFVKDVNDFFKIGDTIFVEIMEVDEETFQCKLSIKNIDYKEKHATVKKRRIIETPHGFNTLETLLPQWIDESLKKQK